jgi:hypothetical protein
MLFTTLVGMGVQSIKMKHSRFYILLITVLTVSSGNIFAQTLSPVGTTKILGELAGVTVSVQVQSPSAEETPLQIVCVFEYTEGDLTHSPPALPANLNGMVHVDKALKGLITELRESGRFAGHALETFLITPPAGSMPARKLLLIGLGNRNNFTPDVMTGVGRVGMREAIKMGVSSYAHASDLKDAGIDSPTGQVAVNVVKGAIDAYETETFLNGKQAAPAPSAIKLTLLAGPAFFAITADAVQAYIQQPVTNLKPD